MLTNKVCLGWKELEQLPRLKYIGVLATGYNVVDLEACRERGIVVTNVPAYSTESVAQMVFAHLLCVTHHVEHYAQQNRQGRWSSSQDFCYWDQPLIELQGKTFGIVGLGNIGRRVAAIAQALGMQVLAYTSKSAGELPSYVHKASMSELPSYVHKASMSELLTTSDVVSLHCPLTVETKHLINEQTLQQMKSTAILINTGRGPLVCDEAVAQALQKGRLHAYCADVLTEEPPRPDNPLLTCSQAYLTPHIAWATSEARHRLVDVATSNVRAFLEGHPCNQVN